MGAEAEAGAVSASVPWWRRSRVRSGLVALVALAAVVWFLNPRAFAGYTSGPHLTFAAPVRDTLPVLANTAASPDREVEVLWARPRVRGGDVGAVQLLLCDGGPEGGVGGGAMPLEPVCSQPREPRRERMVVGDGTTPSTEMVLVVTGSGTETVDVQGVDVLYRDGIRIGYQHVGNRFEVTFDLP